MHTLRISFKRKRQILHELRCAKPGLYRRKGTGTGACTGAAGGIICPFIGTFFSTVFGTIRRSGPRIRSRSVAFEAFESTL